MSDAARLRILFIAPSDSGLDVTPEIDSITELGFFARVLQGKVTPERVFSAVRQSNYDIIHFACHADHDSVKLSDGTSLNVDGILQVARMAHVRLVFLNACTTSTIGQTLVDENVPAVIVTMRGIEDQLAKQTAQAFYKHLALTGNMHEAYRASKPASRGLYQWLSNGNYQQLLLEPILKRLDQLFQTHCSDMERNDHEHSQFQANFAAINENLGSVVVTINDLKTQRVWFLRATVGAVIIVSVVQFILLWVAR